jgi:hypothetical protein
MVIRVRRREPVDGGHETGIVVMGMVMGVVVGAVLGHASTVSGSELMDEAKEWTG